MRVPEKLDWAVDGMDWPNREASRFVEAAGFRWHVQVMGSGPVILLVHGTGASSHSFGELAKILSNAFTVVVPDLPGHGFTDLPPPSRLSMPNMAADLAALLSALELEPRVVVGHSAGAAILIEMCAEELIAPVAVVSINGALLPFGSVAGQFCSPIAKLLVLNPFVPKLFSWRALNEGAVERLIGGTGSQLDAEGLGYYARLFRSETHVEAALGMMASWNLHAFQRRLDSLRVLVILVVGGDDRAISPEDAFKVRDRLPNAEVVYLRGLGHLAHEERPEEIAEIVARAARSAVD
jgi:magnesium chelatase accessory protein